MHSPTSSDPNSRSVDESMRLFDEDTELNHGAHLTRMLDARTSGTPVKKPFRRLPWVFDTIIFLLQMSATLGLLYYAYIYG